MKKLILGYYKDNFKFKLIFCFLLVFIFIISAITMSQLDIDYIADGRKTIQIGDTYVYKHKSYMTKEEEEKELGAKLNICFPSTILNGNNLPLSSFSSNFHYIYLIDDDNLPLDTIIMDKETYYRNQFPESLDFEYNSKENITLKVSSTIFSSKKGVFLNSHFIDDKLIDCQYYYVLVDENNIENICQYLDTHDGLGLINISNKNFDKIREKEYAINRNDAEKETIFFVIPMVAGFILSISVFCYINKNERNIFMMKLEGYSSLKISFVILSIPFFSLLECSLISIPVNMLIINLYNHLISRTTPAIYYGYWTTNQFIISGVTLLIFLVFDFIYLQYKIRKTRG